MKNLIPVILLVCVAFASCKDDEDTPDPKPLTTQEKIQHKWDVTSIIDYNYKGASTTPDYNDTIDIGVGGYVDFRADNKVYTNFDGDLDTSDYQIINDNAISMDGEAFVISELTTTMFQIKYEERTDTPYFDNVITLNR